MCYDAIVIVPGIMGSELRDKATNAVLWGTSDLSWYVSAWSTGKGLAALRLTPDEQDGRYGRVVAPSLLRAPAFARVLAGTEPYTSLVSAVQDCAIDSRAVTTFPYDWRLPVAYNAERLATCADAHLARWHALVKSDRRLRHPDGQRPRLVFVAHSMGGLLVSYVSTIDGFCEEVRTSITLGTPFSGSVKAAVLINSGRGAPVPLPARRPVRYLLNPVADEGLRRLVSTLPGVHDLLPTYRCVDDHASNAAAPARRLSVNDIVDLGGNRELAMGWMALHQRLSAVQPAGHRAVVGGAQPTMQSLTISAGFAYPHWYACLGAADNPRRVDRMGDGTVYRDAAVLGAANKHFYLPQQHAGLAQSKDVFSHIRHVLTEGEDDTLGPPMARDDVGIEAPDLVDARSEATVLVVGPVHMRHLRCATVDLESGHAVGAPLEWRDGSVVASLKLPRPGLYRVEVRGMDHPMVSRLVLAVDPDPSR